MMPIKLPFGSQVYGLTNERSDEDFVVIGEDVSSLQLFVDNSEQDIEFYTVSDFLEKLHNYDIKALEVYFENKELLNKVLNISPFVVVDKDKLRRRVSGTVSNSYVKAKKKIAQGDTYIGLKSYFHCIRILTMYTVLAEKGSFLPSSFKEELENIYLDIINKDSSLNLFNEVDGIYKSTLKQLKKKFQEVCPLSPEVLD